MLIIKILKKIVFVTFFLLMSLSLNLFADCNYDWQHNPHWFSSYCQQYYETWNDCNAYDLVCQQTGSTPGSNSISDDDFNFLNGLAGLMSAFLLWQAFNNANK